MIIRLKKANVLKKVVNYVYLSFFGKIWYKYKYIFQPNQVLLPHQEIPVPHNSRFRFFNYHFLFEYFLFLKFLSILIINRSLIVHYLIGMGHWTLWNFNVYENCKIQRYYGITYFSNCTIFDNEIYGMYITKSWIMLKYLMDSNLLFAYR